MQKNLITKRFYVVDYSNPTDSVKKQKDDNYLYGENFVFFVFFF